MGHPSTHSFGIQCKKRDSFSTSFITVDTLIYTLGQLYNTKSDTHLPTCSIKVVGGIEGDHYISTIKPSVVPDPVLLQGTHVEHGDLHTPRAGYGIQYNFIAQEVTVQQQTKVLLVGQRWVPVSALICPLHDTIE